MAPAMASVMASDNVVQMKHLDLDIDIVLWRMDLRSNLKQPVV